MQLRQIPVLLLLISSLGCDALFYDLTQVDPPNGMQDTGVDQPLDMPDLGDMADLADIGPDLVDMGPDLVDMGPDLVDIGPDLVDMGPPENVCEVGGAFVGQCDPVRQNCPAMKVCIFVYVSSSDQLETRCVADDGMYVIPVGSPCGSSQDPMHCEAGLNCFKDSICRASCDRRDGRGCTDSEFCQTFLPEMSTGYCLDSCD